MKNLLLTLFLTWAINSFGQGDSTSIYYQALRYSNSHFDKYWSDEKEIHIENNNGITEKLPGQVGQRPVTILTWENKKSVYNRHQKKIRHVIVFPARTKDDLIEVNFAPYFGEYKEKKESLFFSCFGLGNSSIKV